MCGIPKIPSPRCANCQELQSQTPSLKAPSSAPFLPQNPKDSGVRCPFPSLDGCSPTGIRKGLEAKMGEFAELAPAASFPVVLFDGEREIDIGNVLVHPSLGFKRFQTIISQKIGFSPSQISTSLVRRKKARSSPEIRRKVPIDESSDFAAIARERDCFVLVILKRSRRTRSRRRGGGGVVFTGEAEQKKAAPVAPEKTILKRNPADGSGVDLPSGGNIFPAAAGLRLLDYESQLQNLRKQREQYLLSTTVAYSPYVTDALAVAEALDSPYDSGLLGWLGPSTPPDVWAARSVLCEECLGAKEEDRSPAFHWCVNDAVTMGFRSAVGPIQRPPKKHIDNGLGGSWFGPLKAPLVTLFLLFLIF